MKRHTQLTKLNVIVKTWAEGIMGFNMYSLESEGAARSTRAVKAQGSHVLTIIYLT